MRKVLPIVISVLFISGCGNYYGHVIESDYSFEGNFGKYETYNFVADKNFQGSELHQELIEKFMTQNLNKWGYKHADKKPSLLVFYKLYYDDFKLQGYSQPNFEQWVAENFSAKIDRSSREEFSNDSDSTFASFNPYVEGGTYGASSRTRYDPILCDLREGTLLISFYDRKKKKTVWQGYASGIFGNDRFDNDRFVRHIVFRILDKYRVMANKAMARNS